MALPAQPPTVEPSVIPQVPPGGSLTMRIRAARTGQRLLLDLSARLTAAGCLVTGMDVVEVAPTGLVVDVSVLLLDGGGGEAVAAAVEKDPVCTLVRVSDAVFLRHLGGKIEVMSRTPLRTRQDMSTIYTPGVARVCEALARRPQDAWSLTMKGSSVAIVTDGSAVLGLGNLGPTAALPVMEGKAAIFRTFAGLSAFPLCLNTASIDELVRATVAIAPGFGGINLEDIAAPACFEVERRVQAEVDIPVFHDDQHGTAAVVMAGLISASRLTGRDFAALQVIVVGAGAAGTAISNALLDAGITDLTIFDKDGVLRDAEDWSAHHRDLAKRTNPRALRSLEAAFINADAVIATSRRGSFEPALVERMAPRPLVFALANPDPEVFPHEVRPDAVIATGRSDLPNQINNSLCFPGFFKGALQARARTVTPAMVRAAAAAIADATGEAQLSAGVIIPTMFQRGLHEAVAAGVAAAVLTP